MARTLIADLGCVPLDAGPLRQARHLEAMVAIVIRLLFRGFDPSTVFNLISPTVVQPTASVASR